MNSIYLNQGEQYIDVFVYVDRPDYDWRFQVTLDIETGQIYDEDPLCGVHPHGVYDEAASPPPADVRAEFQAKRPLAIEKLAPYHLAHKALIHSPE